MGRRWRARRGSGATCRRAPEPTGGWQLGTPDLVVTLPAPFVLPADGPDVSRVFVLPLPVDRLRYVRGIEFRANNPRVHHANIRVDATPASRQLDEQDPAPGYDGIIVRSAVYPDGHFLGWTPGQAAPLLPKGLAWTLAPSSDLVVQLHLVPSGKPESIQPSIGFYFTDDPPKRTPVMLRLSNQRIDIPAGDASYMVTDSFVLPVDVDVLAVQPHAHYLARAVSRHATLPDGSSRTLISISDWDLRWQHVYRYQTPVPLPRGTTVTMQVSVRQLRRQPAESRGSARAGAVGPAVERRNGRLLASGGAEGPARSRGARPDVSREVDGHRRHRARVADPARARPRRTARRHRRALHGAEPAGRCDPHFEAALKLKPDSAAAHFNYGTALAGCGTAR